jgi:hypothetical protein
MGDEGMSSAAYRTPPKTRARNKMVNMCKDVQSWRDSENRAVVSIPPPNALRGGH